MYLLEQYFKNSQRNNKKIVNVLKDEFQLFKCYKRYLKNCIETDTSQMFQILILISIVTKFLNEH